MGSDAGLIHIRAWHESHLSLLVSIQFALPTTNSSKEEKRIESNKKEDELLIQIKIINILVAVDPPPDWHTEKENQMFKWQ